MKKKEKKLKLNQIFQYSESEKLYLIEIRLDDYYELFNGWDATPYKRRDLEPELLEFIEHVGYDIPLKESIKLCFLLPKEKYNKSKEDQSKEAIYNNYIMVMHYIDKALSRNKRKIISYITIAIIFFVLAYTITSFGIIPMPISIASEGLFVGGWVMSWEAFSLFFFIGYDAKFRRKLYSRFAGSDVEFQYREEESFLK